MVKLQSTLANLFISDVDLDSRSVPSPDSPAIMPRRHSDVPETMIKWLCVIFLPAIGKQPICRLGIGQPMYFRTCPDHRVIRSDLGRQIEQSNFM
jgi:hypothetical protein